ncbi:MAG: hypothetical protein ACPGQD_04035, partial [Planctomycetota bacterium]
MRIYYHRDFDGMASAAILADALEATGREREVRWAGVNFDRTLHWEEFALGQDFAVVDFHFHQRAKYWFDHHPTTFLTPEDEAAFAPSEFHAFDPTSPSCPPLVLRHAAEHWGYEPRAHFADLAHWSDIIDAARFESVDQAIFGEDPALRLMRALTASPSPAWVDELATALITESLSDVALRADVE